MKTKIDKADKSGYVTRAYNFEIRAENNEEYGDFITGRPIVYYSNTNFGYFD